MDKFLRVLKSAGSVAGGALAIGLKAAAISIAAITTAAAAASVAIYKITTGAGSWADELITLSTQTGVSTKTLQEWSYAARFIDTEVETMTKGLSKVVKSMATATKSGQDYIQVADGLTVSIRDANGQLRDSEQVFYDSIDAIGALTSETEKEIACQNLFGKSYQDLMPLINAGSAALNQYAAEAASAGLILSDSMIKQLGKFDDLMQKTQAQTQALGRQAAVLFLPALQTIMTGVSALMSTVSTTLSDGFQASDISVIGDALATQITSGLEKASQYMPAIISTISQILSQILNVIVTVLPTLLPALMDGAFQLIDRLISAITANVQPLANMITQIATSLVRYIIKNLPLFLTAALRLVVALAHRAC